MHRFAWLLSLSLSFDAAAATVVSPSFVAVAPTASVSVKGVPPISAAPNGTVKIGDASFPIFPTEKDLKRRATKLAAVPATAGDAFVLVDTEIELTENGETEWLIDDVMVARIDGSGKPKWRQRLSNGSSDPTRHVFVTDKVIVIRQRDRVEAISVDTGKKVWALDRDPTESVLNDPNYWQAKLDEKKNVLWLGGRFPLTTSDGRRTFEMEVDVDTGKRTFASTKYVKPQALPIYVRPPFRLEYPGDRAPPEVPRDWDGLRVRRSYLAWSKTTGEGIIVGPLAADAKTIVDVAKGVKVKGAAVKWRYVVDLQAISIASGASLPASTSALKAAGAKPLDPAILLASDGALLRAGESIDATSVATALGATPLREAISAPPPAQAGALAFYRPDEGDNRVSSDSERTLYLQWGPYLFGDEHEVSWLDQQAPW